MEIDNCVVCLKYLKTISEQENGMCLKCDIETEKVANEIDAQEIWKATKHGKYKRNETN